jgi:hypothetical protein
VGSDAYLRKTRGSAALRTAAQINIALTNLTKWRLATPESTAWRIAGFPKQPAEHPGKKAGKKTGKKTGERRKRKPRKRGALSFPRSYRIRAAFDRPRIISSRRRLRYDRDFGRAYAACILRLSAGGSPTRANAANAGGFFSAAALRLERPI